MKEKRKGPISRAGGLVDSVAATVRRMQRDREPRVLAYDPTGYARLIQPESRGHERILEIGEEMVALSATEPRESGRAAQAASEPVKPARKAPTAGAKAGPKGTRAGAKGNRAGAKGNRAGAKGNRAAKSNRAEAKSTRGGAKSGRGGAKSAGGAASRPRKPKRATPKEDT